MDANHIITHYTPHITRHISTHHTSLITPRKNMISERGKQLVYIVLRGILYFFSTNLKKKYIKMHEFLPVFKQESQFQRI